MLSLEEIKLLSKVLNGEDVDFSTLKEKLNLIVKQIEIQEKAQQEMALLQDKIVKLGDNNEKKED